MSSRWPHLCAYKLQHWSKVGPKYTFFYFGVPQEGFQWPALFNKIQCMKQLTVMDRLNKIKKRTRNNLDIAIHKLNDHRKWVFYCTRIFFLPHNYIHSWCSRFLSSVYHLQIRIVIRMINSFPSEVLTDCTVSLTTSVGKDLLQTSDTLRLNAATQL